jgi:hypothetical protein
MSRERQVLSEIAQLAAWSRRPRTARALAERPKIILASAMGATSPEVASPSAWIGTR